MPKATKQTALYIIFVLSLWGCAYNVENNDKTSLDTTKKGFSHFQTSNLNIDVEDINAYDHEALVLGITCSAHKYKVNLGKDLAQNLSEIDQDHILNNTSKADIKLVASSSKSTLKCVHASIMSGKCQAEVNASGEIISKNGSKKSFKISKKSISPSHTCGDVTKPLRAASDAVIAEIINKLQ